MLFPNLSKTLWHNFKLIFSRSLLGFFSKHNFLHSHFFNTLLNLIFFFIPVVFVKLLTKYLGCQKNKNKNYPALEKTPCVQPRKNFRVKLLVQTFISVFSIKAPLRTFRCKL
jgi:uncharacterized membrane protein